MVIKTFTKVNNLKLYGDTMESEYEVVSFLAVLDTSSQTKWLKL